MNGNQTPSSTWAANMSANRKMKQASYTKGRVEKVSLTPGAADHDPASPEQVEENRTTIGSLS